MPGSPLDRATAQELTRDLTASAKKPVTVIAPFTGTPLHDLPQSTLADVEAAAAAARLAQQTWWAAGFAHRKKVLLRAPIQGSMMTSQIFETVNAAPANAGFTPSVLVM